MYFKYNLFHRLTHTENETFPLKNVMKGTDGITNIKVLPSFTDWTAYWELVASFTQSYV